MKYLLSFLMVGLLFTGCLPDNTISDSDTSSDALVGSVWEFAPAEANPEQSSTLGIEFLTIDMANRYTIISGAKSITHKYTYSYRSSDLTKVTFIEKSETTGELIYLYGRINGDKLIVTDASGSVESIIAFTRIK